MFVNHFHRVDSVHMQDQYESSMMKKKALEDELEDLEGKLSRAEKLLSGALPHTVVLSQYCKHYCC